MIALGLNARGTDIALELNPGPMTPFDPAVPSTHVVADGAGVMLNDARGASVTMLAADGSGIVRTMADGASATQLAADGAGVVRTSAGGVDS